jgi:dihydroorotate dehydrogenase electron transfer subunit
MLRVSSGACRDPLLRRPLSVHRIGIDGTAEFLYKRVGKGTELLSRYRPNDPIGLLGPLGRGFKVPSGTTCIVVGGGLGIAPLLYLAETLPAAPPSAIILGGRSSQDVPRIEDFAALPHKVLITTEDGTLGYRGLVTELLERELGESKVVPIMIYACGPLPMMRAVNEIAARAGVSCQVSLEARMACGIGLCLGCAVPQAGRGGYKHVCRDGPVFDAGSIDWESILL